MKTSNQYIEYWVAKNMIAKSNKKNIEEIEIEKFIERYKDIISLVIKYMPRGMTSIGAAVANCAIKYNKELAIKFLKNSKEELFNGKDDPVYHFYLWLHGIKGPKRKKNDISTREITMYACKQYCLGNKIKRLYRSKDTINWLDVPNS
jgi:hypothetical protein